MKLVFVIVALGGAVALSSCNSTSASKFRESCDAACHAHHTPEQHAAFLKRVGQLEAEEIDSSGLGGGGGGGHHH